VLSTKRTPENRLGRLWVKDYKGRVDHDWKVKNRRQRRDIGKYSFLK
jgi:hypothetical protein